MWWWILNSAAEMRTEISRALLRFNCSMSCRKNISRHIRIKRKTISSYMPAPIEVTMFARRESAGIDACNWAIQGASNRQIAFCIFCRYSCAAAVSLVADGEVFSTKLRTTSGIARTRHSSDIIQRSASLIVHFFRATIWEASNITRTAKAGAIQVSLSPNPM